MPYVEQFPSPNIDVEEAHNDWDGWLRKLGDDQRQAVDQAFQFSTAETLQRDRQRFLSAAQVSIDLGADPFEVSRNFENYYQPIYANSVLEMPEAGTDAGKFYGAIVERRKKQREESELFNGINQKVLEGIIAGDSTPTIWEGVRASFQGNAAWSPEKERDLAKHAYLQAHEIRTIAEPLRPLADRLAISLTTAHTLGDMSEELRELRHLSERDLAMVNELMTTRLKPVDSAGAELSQAYHDAGVDWFHRINRNAHRKSLADAQRVLDEYAKEDSVIVPEDVKGIRGIVEYLKTNGSYMRPLPSSMRSESKEPLEGTRFLSQEEIEQAKQEVKEQRGDLHTLAKLERFTDEKRNPTADNNLFMRYMAIPATKSLPITLAALMGGAGLMGNVRYYEEEEIERLHSLGVDDVEAQKSAVYVGVLKAVAERLQARFLLGKMPGTRAVLSRFAAPGGSTALRFGAYLGTNVVAETGIELLQDYIIPAAVQDIRQVGGDVTWLDDKGPVWTALRAAPETAAAVFLFGLVGSGMATVSDVQGANEMVKNRNLLLQSGYSEAQTDEVLAQEDPALAIQKARELWGKRNGTPQSMVKAAEETKREESELSRALDAAAERGIIPRIQRVADGWAVTDSEGSVVTVATIEEVGQIVAQHVSRNEAERVSAITEAFDALSRPSDELDFDNSRRANLKAGKADKLGTYTEEQATEAAIVQGRLDGLTEEEARNITYAVLGTNKVEQVEQVRDGVVSLVNVSRSKLNEGANVLTAIEEPVHGNWTRGLMENRWTQQEGLSWVRMAENILGEKLLHQSDAEILAQPQSRALTEAIGTVVIADAVGRRKDGSRLLSGAISRGLAAEMRNARDMDRGAVGKFRQFLRAWRERFAQVFSRARSLAKAREEGRISEDFDAFLDELMSADPQARHERGVAQEAESLIWDEGMAYVPPSAEEEAGGIVFSLLHEKFLQVDEGVKAVRNEDAAKIRAIDAEKVLTGVSYEPARRWAADKFERYARLTESGQLQDRHLSKDFRRDYLPMYRTDFREHEVSYDFALSLVREAIRKVIGDSTAKYDYPSYDERDGQVRRQGASDAKSEAQAADRAVQGEQARQEQGNADEGQAVDFRTSPGGEVHFSIVSAALLERMASAGRETTAGELGINEAFHASRVPDLVVDAFGSRETRQGRGHAGFYAAPDASETEQYRRMGSGYLYRIEVPEDARVKIHAGGMERISPEQLSEWKAQGFEVVAGKAVIGRKVELVLLNPQNVALVEQPESGVSFSLQNRGEGVNSRDDQGAENARRDSPSAFVSARDVARGDQGAVRPKSAGATLRGFSREREGQFKRLLEWARQNGRIFHAGRLGDRIDEGGEHTVHLSQDDPSRVYKVTFPTFSGLTHVPIRRGKSSILAEDDALPDEYLERWELHNQVFADDVEFVGVMEGERGPSLVISQRILEGTLPSREAVSGYMSDLGFASMSDGRWYRSTDGMIAADTKPANFILTGGKVVPFDVILLRATPAIFESQAGETQFSLRPRQFLDRVGATLASRIRNPEQRAEFYALAKRRLDALRADSYNWRHDVREGLDSIAERDRTAASLETERKFRYRSRQRELIDQGMSSLSRETVDALHSDEALGDARENPLIAEMISPDEKAIGGFRGRLRSFSQADEKTQNEYDDMPEGLPRWMFGGTLAPDQLAQELYDTGLIVAPTPTAMWKAVGAAFNTANTFKAGFNKARASVAKIERDAKSRAKRESDKWHEKARASVPTAHDKMMATLRMMDAILSVFPAEIRGRVGGVTKLASLKTDKARMKHILAKLDNLDKLLEKHLQIHFSREIEKVLEKARPESEGGKRPKGKLGGAVHEWFTKVEAATEVPLEEVEGKVLAIQAQLSKETDEKKRLALIQDHTILEVFGGTFERSSSEMADILADLQQAYETGRDAWMEKMAARAESDKALIATAFEELGNTGLHSEQSAASERNAKRQRLSEAARFVYTFRSMLGEVFGMKSKIQDHFTTGQVKSENGYRDGVIRTEAGLQSVLAPVSQARGMVKGRGVRAQRRANASLLWNWTTERNTTITILEGRKVSVEKLALEDARGFVENDDPSYSVEQRNQMREQIAAHDDAVQAGSRSGRRKNVEFTVVEDEGRDATVKLTQAEMAYILAIYAQEDLRPSLEASGYDERAIDEIREKVDPDVLSAKDWMVQYLEAEHAPLSAIYDDLFGVRLPRIQNYFPARFRHDGNMLAPELGGALNVSMMKSGFLRQRKSHAALLALDFERGQTNIFSVFMRHTAQSQYWQNYARFMRETKAVLNNGQVQDAMRVKAGQSTADELNGWIMALEAGGVADAKLNEAFADEVRKRIGAKAGTVLGFKVSNLAVQTTSALNAMYDTSLPLSKVLTGYARVLSGKSVKGIKEILELPVIQRRLAEGGSISAQWLREMARNEEPGALVDVANLARETMGLVDSKSASVALAVAYDVHHQDAKAKGLDDVAAAEHAELETEKTAQRILQPVEMGGKARYEMIPNPFLRLVTLFASEARQKIALEIEAGAQLKRNPGSLDAWKNFGRIAIMNHLVIGTTIWVLKSIVRDMMSATEDDDDDPAWEWEDWLANVILGPISGVPLIGTGLESLIGFVFHGGYKSGSNPFIDGVTGTAGGAAAIWKGMTEMLTGDLDAKEREDAIKGMDKLVGGVAVLVGSPAFTGGAILWNVVSQGMRTVNNLTAD